MSSKDLIAEALALPGRERARLVSALLDSLQDEPEEQVQEAWAAELERRAREALTDESVLEDWQSVRTQLRERMRSTRQ